MFFCKKSTILKQLVFLLLLISCLCLNSPVAYSGGTLNNIGLYFDEVGSQNCLSGELSYPVTVSAHLVLKNLAETGGVSAWEASVSWDPSLFVQLANLRGQALSVTSFPEMVVGLGEPLTGASSIVLADFLVTALGPGRILLKPASEPMIEGAESPIFIFGNNPNHFGLMSYAYGDSGSASCVIGDLPCPVENNHFFEAPDTTGTGFSDELVVVVPQNSVFFPDRNTSSAVNRLIYSAPQLKRALFGFRDVSIESLFPGGVQSTIQGRDENQIELLGGNQALVLHTGSEEMRNHLYEVLADIPEVLSVEYNAIGEDLGSNSISVNDPGYDFQWGLHGTAGIGWESVWDENASPNAVTICIVDRGVRDGHQEFLGKRSGDTSFTVSHGARVAGIAAAIANNGEGVVGVAWNSRVDIQKRGDSVADIAQAISEGLRVNPHIMNHSYRIISDGQNYYSPIIHRLFLDSYRSGTLHSIAAGNHYDSGNPDVYPAMMGATWEGYSPGMMVVGGIDHFGNVYSESSSGPHIDHAAPAINIVSTTNYDLLGPGKDGTSYAAPFSSGAAAVLLSLYPNLDPIDVENVLNLSAHDIYPPGHDHRTGWGRLNLSAALDSLALNDFSTKRGYYQSSDPFEDLEFVASYSNTVLEGFRWIDPVPRDLSVYRLQYYISFGEEYYEPPHVWGVSRHSTGMTSHPWYNVPYTNVIPESISTEGCMIETYVYHLGGDDFIPQNFGDPYAMCSQISILGKEIPITSGVSPGINLNISPQISMAGPNPFNSQTSLRLGNIGVGGGALSIFNIRGHRVRQWDFGPTKTEELISWDGCDAAGRVLPAGVYFAVLTARDRSDCQKLLLVK